MMCFKRKKKKVMMETEDKSRVVSSSSGSVSISLHPLVIMNISDHFTRLRMQGGGNSTGDQITARMFSVHVLIPVYLIL